MANAIGDFSKAIRLEPKGPKAYDERGAVHAERGEMAQATADREKAEALAVGCDPKTFHMASA